MELYFADIFFNVQRRFETAKNNRENEKVKGKREK